MPGSNGATDQSVLNAKDAREQPTSRWSMRKRKSPRTYATTGGLVLLPVGRGRGEGECPTGLRLIWGGRSLLQPHQYVTPTGARGKIGLSGTMQEPDAG